MFSVTGKWAAGILAVSLVASCETATNSSSAGQIETSAPLVTATETIATMGAPTGIKLNGRGFSVTFADGTVCRDPAAKSYQDTTGTFSGSFPNCPGVTYTLSVTQKRNRAADVLLFPGLGSASMKYSAVVVSNDQSYTLNVGA